jgi:hypothetical protein
MATELTVNTRVNEAIQYILNEETDPILDIDGTRYLLDVSNWGLGKIMWTPFVIETQTIDGEYSYSYPYAAHSTLRDVVINASSRNGPRAPLTTTYPTRTYDPLPNGSVTP